MTAEEDFFSEVAARRAMVCRTHPILKTRGQEIQACHIPPEQALAFRLEEREVLEAQLRINEAEIKILRDCSQVA